MTKKIPFFDYPQLFKSHEKELSSVFKDVGKRGAFIMQKDLEIACQLKRLFPLQQGKRLSSFNSKFKEFVKEF